ncbi:hypothetical protein C8046_11820 [Serinibacter arcticus]|uniref:ESX-1 secretion-associated protein n=1 Tax=Serinibacter arcticus TaxID=1655435 RepID=A0A2U1ZW84_9MICO|nr:type VII secretion target [Serinibacter arcticus]PWD51239.1 hypothetical protein C8046_11820 [Serinibacter arcticus]
MSFEVTPSELRGAAGTWQDHGESLGSANAHLGTAQGATTALGPRVQAAADTFLTQWKTTVADAAGAAASNSVALSGAADAYDSIDEEQGEALRRLLPWAG